MDLTREFVDVAVFTNRLDEMRDFYGGKLGLAFVEMVPIGKKIQQHRYALGNSVFKLNAAQDPLTPRSAAGYKALVIADPKTAAPKTFSDPDGNTIGLVPPGHNGIDHVEVQLGVSDLDGFEHFYGEVLGAARLGGGRFRLGRTIFAIAADPAARRFVPPPRKEGEPAPAGLRATADMVALGLRYFTVQVRDCVAEDRRLVAAGATEAAAPMTGNGPTVAVCFFRDPDGNWIEIIQRN
jgi:catechol 2,3-dioxygenase-like lactoylglutathione lyase family enzyme